MPKIKFAHLENAFEVPVGSTILECALENGVALDHDCGGNCACTTCQVWVEKGAELLSTMSEDELALLEANEKLGENSRLGCQSRVRKDGEILVRIPGVS